MTWTDSCCCCYFCYSKSSSHKILTGKEQHCARAFYLTSSFFAVVELLFLVGSGGRGGHKQKYFNLIFGNGWLPGSPALCGQWLLVYLFVCTGVFSVASLEKCLPADFHDT